MKKIIIWVFILMVLFPFGRYAFNQVYLLSVAKRTTPATTAQQRHVDEAEKDYLSDFASSKEEEIIKLKKIAQDPKRSFSERKAALKIMKQKELEIQNETGLTRAKKIARDWLKSIPDYFSGSPEQDTRPLSGIYKLPADGRIVEKTIDGREIWDKKGWRARYNQLGKPGRFMIVCTQIPSWESSDRVTLSGYIEKEGQIRLMSAGGRELTVQVEIIK